MAPTLRGKRRVRNINKIGKFGAYHTIWWLIYEFNYQFVFLLPIEETGLQVLLEHLQSYLDKLTLFGYFSWLYRVCDYHHFDLHFLKMTKTSYQTAILCFLTTKGHSNTKWTKGGRRVRKMIHGKGS